MDASQKIYLLKVPAVEDRFQVSKAGIYARLNPADPAYDPDFPAPIRIGKNAVRFIEHELEAYFATRPRTGSKTSASK